MIADVRTMPARIARLPRDARGYPVPFFVPWLDERGELTRDGQGTPQFSQMNPNKFVAAVRFRLCWVCGDRLGTHIVFVLGPMCGVNRTTSEPPCHLECAEYSAKACPFLSRPKMRRIDDEAYAENCAGHAITRNPGVTLLWTTRRYRVFDASKRGGREGLLIRVGDPERVAWYREGRAATRAEVAESVDSGMAHLTALASLGGPEAISVLKAMYRAFLPLLPSSDPEACA